MSLDLSGLPRVGNMDSAERGDCGRCSSRSCQCIGEEFWRREDVIEALRIRDACALIRLARRYTDLTQQELAEITGLTQPMISLIERGKTRRLGRERQQRALHGLEARATLLPPMEEWGIPRPWPLSKPYPEKGRTGPV
ncbi:helix-turn-helix domain-containing protein [Nocardiopsis composta]